MTTSFSSNSSLGIVSGGDPVELWEEIVRNIDDSVWTDPAKMILNVAHGQCVDATVIVDHMRSLGVSDEEILRRVYLIDNYTFFTNYAKRLGFKNVIHGDFLEMEFDVKFDLIIGNPPFGEGKTRTRAGESTSNIFPQFFAKAIELADTVAMVMPETRNAACSAHNQLIADNASIVQDVSIAHQNEMGVSKAMWYVICDKSDRKADVEFTYGQVNNDIDWKMGRYSVKDEEKNLIIHDTKFSDSDLTFLRTKGDEGYVSRDLVKSDWIFPNSGYAVIMPQTTREKNGMADVRVVKCDGNQVLYYMDKVVFFRTKNQATMFVDMISSEDAIKQMWSLRSKHGDKLTLGNMRAIKFDKEDEDYIING